MIIMASRGDDILFTGLPGMVNDGRHMRRLPWELVAHVLVPLAPAPACLFRLGLEQELELEH